MSCRALPPKRRPSRLQPNFDGGGATRPLHRMKKKYQVIKATTKNISGVVVGGRVKKFGKNGTFETTDPGEAAEIDKVLGMKGTGEVVVTNYTEKEHGHNYTFTVLDFHSRGGNEAVKVKTADGFTFVSRVVAEEEGYDIVLEKNDKRKTKHRDIKRRHK